jgi:hypothetical protein
MSGLAFVIDVGPHAFNLRLVDSIVLHQDSFDTLGVRRCLTQPPQNHVFVEAFHRRHADAHAFGEHRQRLKNVLLQRVLAARMTSPRIKGRKR